MTQSVKVEGAARRAAYPGANAGLRRVWHTLIHADTPTSERLVVLRAYNVRYVMANAGTGWVKQILSDAPDHLAWVTEKGTLRLYELTQRMH